MNPSPLLKSALACALTLGLASTASVAMAQQSMSMHMTPAMMRMRKEKTMMTMKRHHFVACYGINAAYKNDCQSPGHSCAGQDSRARDAHAFVAMPAGPCEKMPLLNSEWVMRSEVARFPR